MKALILSLLWIFFIDGGEGLTARDLDNLYTLKKVNSNAASVERIHVSPDGSSVLVSGFIRLNVGFYDKPGNHICVTVVSPAKVVLSDVRVTYNHVVISAHSQNRNISFAVSLKAPPGSMIIVSHHNSNISHCYNLR